MSCLVTHIFNKKKTVKKDKKKIGSHKPLGGRGLCDLNNGFPEDIDCNVYIFLNLNPSLRAGRIWNSADDVESKIKSIENQTEETRGQLSLALGTTY